MLDIHKTSVICSSIVCNCHGRCAANVRLLFVKTVYAHAPYTSEYRLHVHNIMGLDNEVYMVAWVKV